jgi:uncharacterized Zn finger protein (UPF0148 family)
MCKTVCPQCGYEYEFERGPLNSGKWTAEEDKQLLQGYQTERKTLAQIAEDMNRSQDAVRNRLYILRGAGRKNEAAFIIHTTPAEYEKMRAAKKQAKAAKQELKKTTAALKKISALLADSGFIRDFDEEFVITNKAALQEALYIAKDCLREG